MTPSCSTTHPFSIGGLVTGTTQLAMYRFIVAAEQGDCRDAWCRLVGGLVSAAWTPCRKRYGSDLCPAAGWPLEVVRLQARPGSGPVSVGAAAEISCPVSSSADACP